jgi:hypothetical protein
MQRFYLGTHETGWLARAGVPLFVSRTRLARRRSLPRAIAPWALDSGAFSEIANRGRWTLDEDRYVEEVARYGEEIGRLEWAAPMDWMVEPEMLARTGLDVVEHQRRTVENYLRLRGRGPFVPVLQGWTRGDYARCARMYEDAGVELAREPVVGVGSVCRRQATAEIGAIFDMLDARGIRAHGFGVKTGGLAAYGPLLHSADSMSWSYAARRRPPLPGCPHRSCQNCLRFALAWRRRVVAAGG